MATKKKVATTKAKVTKQPLETLIAVDALAEACTNPVDSLFGYLLDGAYYCEKSVEEISNMLEQDGFESEQAVYKVTFTKIGSFKKPQVSFTEAE